MQSAPVGDAARAVAWLMTPEAVRARCGEILLAARDGALEHFSLDDAYLDQAANYVIETIRENWPGLDIPLHSRWRHFLAGGIDRWATLSRSLAASSPEEIARIRFDLVVISVLLDAGAGDVWRYQEAETGARLARSEGLAVASLRAFATGAFSDQPNAPLRADAARLARIDDAAIALLLQVTDDNKLAGLEGRAALMRRVGEVVVGTPDLFGRVDPRIGNLFDHLAARAEDGKLPAAALLEAVHAGFGPIWPGRIALEGVNLGDMWRHPAIRTDDATDGLVPFHKLSQWLSYSLIEPLQDYGIEITEIERLTALAEYRNGGLLVDIGLVRPRHDGVLAEAHPAGSEIIVEWRALTVSLIDVLAERIRAGLGLDAHSLPLAKVLEGGTWSAGRKIAAERRPGGGPPIRVISDGTVF